MLVVLLAKTAKILTGIAVLAAAYAVPANAQEVLAPPTTAGAEAVVPLVDHFGGVSAWSELETDPGGRRYVLTALAGGQRARLPVAPRSVPLDVDLGPDEKGNVVAIYTTGRGCDLYRYDFRFGQEQKLPGASTNQASEVLPSIWKDEIAFVRVYEHRAGDRGTYPYLYARSLRADARSRRQPGGSRGTTGLPAPPPSISTGDG